MTHATIIDGRGLATQVRHRIREAVDGLRAGHHLRPCLAVVLVGEHPASQVYVRNKAQQSEETGMVSHVHRLPADLREEDLLTLVRGLNQDHQVHGILVQLPLPEQIDPGRVLEAIDPAKDVDGFHLVNAGRLFTGVAGALVPCTPLGCLTLLRTVHADLSGLAAVVVGRSNIVGKPMAHLLLGENATVTIAHSRSRDLPGLCRSADILVAAIGRPRLIQGDWIKPGATVIDVGINRIDAGEGKTKLVGDVDYAEALAVAGAITPVPGGVGPMTIACLLRNTVTAACLQHGVDVPEM